MKVEQRRVNSLIPYAKNAKKHSDKQIQNVAKSIREYGFVQPVVIDRGGIIVIGHCRVLAAKTLNMEEVPCVCVDDLTPEQVDALRIVDNKTNESEWDIDTLEADLLSLDLSEFDFDWGSDEKEYSPDDFGDDFSLADGGKPEICQMTFTMHIRQKELIEYAIQQVKDTVTETFGNTNSNGNALYEVVRQWAGQKK